MNTFQNFNIQFSLHGVCVRQTKINYNRLDELISLSDMYGRNFTYFNYL